PPLRTAPMICQSLESLIGRERYFLLMRVLSLPDDKVEMAHQLMKLLNVAENGNAALRIEKTPENEDLVMMLTKAFYLYKSNEQIKARLLAQPPAQPKAIPRKLTKTKPK